MEIEASAGVVLTARPPPRTGLPGGRSVGKDAGEFGLETGLFFASEFGEIGEGLVEGSG